MRWISYGVHDLLSNTASSPNSGVLYETGRVSVIAEAGFIIDRGFTVLLSQLWNA